LAQFIGPKKKKKKRGGEGVERPLGGLNLRGGLPFNEKRGKK